MLHRLGIRTFHVRGIHRFHVSVPDVGPCAVPCGCGLCFLCPSSTQSPKGWYPERCGDRLTQVSHGGQLVARSFFHAQNLDVREIGAGVGIREVLGSGEMALGLLGLFHGVLGWMGLRFFSRGECRWPRPNCGYSRVDVVLVHAGLGNQSVAVEIVEDCLPSPPRLECTYRRVWA